jgi:zinc transport system substrate-binding protein
LWDFAGAVIPKRGKMKRLIELLGIVLLMLGCNTASMTPKSDIRRLTVSILPQKFFVSRIAGDRWKINVMIPPGHNPATYEPTAFQMKNLSNSSIYFRIGHIPFEATWMKTFISLNPGMKVVDTSLGIDVIQSHGHHHHANPEDSRFESRGIDPHIWLSPVSVKTIARHIYQNLVKADPLYQSVYHKNFKKFLIEINELDLEIKQIFKDTSKKKFLVFHPAWSYFARDYRLIQIPIEIDGKHPRPADLKKLIDLARSEEIRFIIVQKQFDTHSAKAIMNEINGQVIQLDPLSENWPSNLKTIAIQMKNMLSKGESDDIHEHHSR